MKQTRPETKHAAVLRTSEAENPSGPTRRDFLLSAGGAAAIGCAGGTVTLARAEQPQGDKKPAQQGKPAMKLGIVTYNIAKDWDIETIIKNCKQVGLSGVELRTTHAHGVEPTLSKAQRTEVRKKFQDGGIEISGLGSTCEYHSPDPAELTKQIDLTKRFVELAADVGAPAVKVRPNGLPKAVPVDKTLEQIGLSLRQCGDFAKPFGVEIRLEVHGSGTSNPACIKKIMDVANHDSVFVCWNSNDTDMDKQGSIDNSFSMLASKIRQAHITELWSKYPWRRLFELLTLAGFKGYTLAEIPGISDPVRLLRYYRALWLAMQPATS
jgi:sugar phosphate isomerase/epimerase